MKLSWDDPRIALLTSLAEAANIDGPGADLKKKGSIL